MILWISFDYYTYFFCILAHRLFAAHFVQAFFSSQIQKYCPLKVVWFVQRYSIFLIESVEVLHSYNLLAWTIVISLSIVFCCYALTILTGKA